jgi:hypothetical protein
MGTLTVRKNFKFDRELIDKVGEILQKKNLNFTQLLTHYFQAVIKEPELIDTIEKKSKQRTGNFIGMLDGVIGDIDYKEMKKSHNEHRA